MGRVPGRGHPLPFRLRGRFGRWRSRSVAGADALDHHATPGVHALLDEHPALLAKDRARVTTLAPERWPRRAEPDRAGVDGRTEETPTLPVGWPDDAPLLDPALFHNDAPLNRRAQADLLVKAEIGGPSGCCGDRESAAEG